MTMPSPSANGDHSEPGNGLHAALALEDGTVLTGTGFGAETVTTGELVFCTSMTGYQEALTDPSYAGQVLLLTYPQVGNYGIHEEQNESDQIQAEGLVIRDPSGIADHPESDRSLHRFLREEGVPGIAGIDTRALTLEIREKGVIQVALSVSNEPVDSDNLVERARSAPPLEERNLVEQVTRQAPAFYEGNGPRISILDLGMKNAIRDAFLERGCTVTVHPAFSDPADIREADPDGVVLSPGPGDPQNLTEVVETADRLIEDYPVFGICLGHQVLALAAGAETYKLKFGHRGANQPVKDLSTDRVQMTSQNHGFAVEADTVPSHRYRINRMNLNDGTVEGMTHRDKPVVTLQYHPEASPGPRDSSFLFDDFLEKMQV